MTIQLTEQQQQFVNELQVIDSPANFQALRIVTEAELKAALAETEVQAPQQALALTVAEATRLFLFFCEELPAHPDRTLLRDAIRLLSTIQSWFGEGLREGAYRTRTAREVIEASRPWRAKCKLLGKAVFGYQPQIAAEFADVNSTSTLDEERRDLQNMLSLLKLHEGKLQTSKHFTPKLIEDGKALLAEVEGRDLLSILGLENQQQAISLRNRLLTYLVVLGKRAAANGALEFFEVDEEKQKRFEGFTFANALRKITAKKEEAPEPTPAPENK